jgi:hypothetical protein
MDPRNSLSQEGVKGTLPLGSLPLWGSEGVTIVYPLSTEDRKKNGVICFPLRKSMGVTLGNCENNGEWKSKGVRRIQVFCCGEFIFSR